MRIELEVPGLRDRFDFIPRRQAGKRHVEDCHALHVAGKLARIGIGHHAANVVADQHDALGAEALNEPVQVTRHRGLREIARRRCRAADSRQIHCDHAIARCKPGHDLVPLVGILRPAMQQDDQRLTRSRFQITEALNTDQCLSIGDGSDWGYGRKRWAGGSEPDGHTREQKGKNEA